jgi:hypothetical protein
MSNMGTAMAATQRQRKQAAEFYALAAQYKTAANLLCTHWGGPERLSIREPIYFLHHHAVELVLQAYLRSHAARGAPNHDIWTMYKECKKHGLVVADDQHFEVQNLIALLQGLNEQDFYRYPNDNRHIGPDIVWAQDVVKRLFEAVAPHAEGEIGSTRRIYFGKPTHESQPSPKNPGP